MNDQAEQQVIARNREALRNYQIIDRMEAGIVLLGSEVKSLRAGHVQIRDAYARLSKAGELYLVNCRIEPYEHTTHDQPDPMRDRKLLLHRRQLKRLIGQLREKGRSLVALRMYFVKGRAKVELGLGTGRSRGDKRELVREREEKRGLQREFKGKIKT